jgi:large subunit ribosomal protein L40
VNRMYQSMHSACEELRTMDPPGTKDAGRLYRIAMEKKGIFGHGGVPIEYARLQTDTPGRDPWNHGWTR